MKCLCGFKFSEPGEFRNCPAFITSKGKSGFICPNCGNKFVDGKCYLNDKNSKSSEVKGK